MRKLLFIFILALFFIGSVSSHPPQDVTGSFNLSDKTLTVEVTHRGGGGTRHFIDTITITRNGREILKQEISSQSNDVQPFVYLLPDVEAGDQLAVNVTCNISGSRQLNITVRGSQTPAPAPAPAY